MNMFTSLSLNFTREIVAMLGELGFHEIVAVAMFLSVDLAIKVILLTC